MKVLKNIFLLFILLLLASSALQYSNNWNLDPPLHGYSASTSPPELKYFTWARWFKGKFQSVFSNKLNENIGFRNTAVRIFNQVDYSLFGLTHAPGFLEGKEGYLYEEDYIHEYTGRYFIGKNTIDEKLTRLKEVMAQLGSVPGKPVPLILILEGGKAEIYPEYIPDRFHPDKRKQTNRDYFVAKTREMGIPILDLHPFLQRIKDTAQYPVFSRYGMHWSLYATYFVADTISRYLEKRISQPMPHFKMRYLHHTNQSLLSDHDIADMFNLIFPLKATSNAYPVVPFKAITPGRLRALIIADSYYVQLTETYAGKMFATQDFWYYNSRLYPFQNEESPRMADKTGLREKLLGYDVILLMVSDINFHTGFWGFADEAWHAFHPENPENHLERIENSMRIDRDWFRFMIAKAEKVKKPLDQVIKADAEYMFYTTFADLQNKNRVDSILYIRAGIKSNPDWYGKVMKKAKERNIALEEMLLMDATYTYEETKKKP